METAYLHDLTDCLGSRLYWILRSKHTLSCNFSCTWSLEEQGQLPKFFNHK